MAKADQHFVPPSHEKLTKAIQACIDNGDRLLEDTLMLEFQKPAASRLVLAMIADPVALGALAARCRRRIRVAVVQRPQHGNAGHHNNAALLGGKDQNFHGNLPMLALGFGRWQRKDINAGVAEASKFAAIAGWDRIVKLGSGVPGRSFR